MSEEQREDLALPATARRGLTPKQHGLVAATALILGLFSPTALAVLLTGLCLAVGVTKAVSLARLARSEEVLAPSTEERGRRCPFCREDFAAHDVVESCAACETVYHAECRREFGACATFACDAPAEAGRRFAIAQDLIVGWEHPEAVEIEGEVATPFPYALNYDEVTGLRRLGVEDYGT